MPHGGPEARDEYGHDSFVQFLASRGYVVVPNFRSMALAAPSPTLLAVVSGGRLMQDDVTGCGQPHD
ncbi:MAG: hypothetical protein R3C16_10595 [Hyphomonadaceae bacterium]